MNQKILNVVFGAVILVLIGIVAYLTMGEDSEQPSNQQNETAGWRTFKGQPVIHMDDLSTTFSIQYPVDWELGGNTLYPFGQMADRGLETRIILGAAGRGAPEPQTKKNYPAGTANYYWNSNGSQTFGYATFRFENTIYSFTVDNLPTNKSNEFEGIFDKMLSTFQIVGKN